MIHFPAPILALAPALVLLTIVAAACDNDVIGNHNELLFKLPKDFERMKTYTMGKPLIMGRKTHESIGRALPGRQNIVITRDAAKTYPGCDVVHSLEDAVALAKDSGAEEAIIFGGADIYRQAMPMSDKIVFTRIHASPDGDALFPSISSREWKKVWSEEHAADAEHPVPFTFETYELMD